MEAFLHAFAAMDFPAALALLSDDVEYTNIPMGTVRGHAGVREVLEPFFAPIHENEFVILRRSATGSVVFLERLDRHRLDHGWRELPSTPCSRSTTVGSPCGGTTSTSPPPPRSTTRRRPDADDLTVGSSALDYEAFTEAIRSGRLESVDGV